MVAGKLRGVIVTKPPNYDSRQLITHKVPICYSAQTNTAPSFRQTDLAEGPAPGRAGRDIRVVDRRHEATSLFSVDATARLPGWPGVTAVTAGPSGGLPAVPNPHTATFFDVVSYVRGSNVLSSLPHDLATQA